MPEIIKEKKKTMTVDSYSVSKNLITHYIKIKIHIKALYRDTKKLSLLKSKLVSIQSYNIKENNINFYIY